MARIGRPSKRDFSAAPLLAQPNLGVGPVSVTQFNAAAGLAHPSKAIAAMSKKPKAAAAK